MQNQHLKLQMEMESAESGASSTGNGVASSSSSSSSSPGYSTEQSGSDTKRQKKSAEKESQKHNPYIRVGSAVHLGKKRESSLMDKMSTIARRASTVMRGGDSTSDRDRDRRSKLEKRERPSRFGREDSFGERNGTICTLYFE